jgi:hypothetical protein
MEYFCLNCKKNVKTYMNIFMGFKRCCKKCKMDRIMELETMSKKDFDELSKKFKKHTESF